MAVSDCLERVERRNGGAGKRGWLFGEHEPQTNRCRVRPGVDSKQAECAGASQRRQLAWLCPPTERWQMGHFCSVSGLMDVEGDGSLGDASASRDSESMARRDAWRRRTREKKERERKRTRRRRRRLR
jgi:hypothetical protein